MVQLLPFVILLLSAGCVTVTSALPDSFGTEFETIFPWNNGDTNADVTVMMDFVTHDKTKNATVVVTYFEWSVTGWDITLTPRTKTVFVKALSSESFIFSSASVYQYLGQGMNRYPDTRVNIKSDNPISVIAHNFMKNGTDGTHGAGDLYTVLPRSMGSTSYALSLPEPARGGFAMVYFLPTMTDADISLTIITATSTNRYLEKAGFAPQSDVLMYGGPSKAFTLFASSNSPFVILVAMRRLPIASGSQLVDFGCFMPSPMGSTLCKANSMQEDHVTDLSSSNYFIMTPSSPTCSLTVDVAGSTGAVRKIDLGMNVAQTPRDLTSAEFGTNINAHSNSALFHMLRYGGFNVGGKNYEEGAFIDMVPSFSQAVTGTTGYTVPSDYDQIVVTGDLKTKQTSTHDGTYQLIFQEIPHFPGGYMALATVTSGFHYFSSEGLYTLHVSGSANHYAYGYTASYNKHRVIVNGTIPTDQPTVPTTPTRPTAPPTVPTSPATQVTSRTAGPPGSTTTSSTTTTNSSTTTTEGNKPKDDGVGTIRQSAPIAILIATIVAWVVNK